MKIEMKYKSPPVQNILPTFQPRHLALLASEHGQSGAKSREHHEYNSHRINCHSNIRFYRIKISLKEVTGLLLKLRASALCRYGAAPTTSPSRKTVGLPSDK